MPYTPQYHTVPHHTMLHNNLALMVLYERIRRGLSETSSAHEKKKEPFINFTLSVNLFQVYSTLNTKILFFQTRKFVASTLIVFDVKINP